MNPEISFMCPECGPRPDFLCMDGVCIGISLDNIKNQKDSDPFLEYSEKRMFVKEKKNRDLIRSACSREKLPDLRSVKFEKDPGMLIIREFIQEIKSEGHSEIPSEYIDVLLDISSVSSTISMLQINKKTLINRLIENLNSPDTQLMCDPENLHLKQEIFRTFPLIYKRLDNISRMVRSDGKLPNFVKKYFVEILKFCMQYCDSLPVRQDSDYLQRIGGEIKAEVFPNFPLLKEKKQIQGR